MEPDAKNFEAAPELPQPEGGAESADNYEFRAAATPETQIGPSQTQPVMSQSVAPVTDDAIGSTSVPPVPSMPVGTNGQAANDLIADDSDLIEKEWVMKAKAIVAHTKDDPHRQNVEMTKVKADYLKKRYNKDLKASEG